jgi:DNA-binding CsgD family transcriptional regulator
MEHGPAITTPPARYLTAHLVSSLLRGVADLSSHTGDRSARALAFRELIKNIVGADGAMALIVAPDPDGPQVRRSISTGDRADQPSPTQEFFAHDRSASSLVAAAFNRSAEGADAGNGGSDAWVASLPAMGCIPGMRSAVCMSARPLADAGGAAASVLLACRPDDKGPFSPEALAVVQILHADVLPSVWPIESDGAPLGGSRREVRAAPLQPDVLVRIRQLSPAQRRVLPLLLEGLPEKEIAKRLFRSRHTIHDHTKAIYTDLQVRSRLELIMLLGSRSGLEAALDEPSPA